MKTRKKGKELNKKSRENIYNHFSLKAGKKKPLSIHDLELLMNIFCAYEDLLTDLRKKMYSKEFLKKRIKKFYPEDPKFTQFILYLTEG